MIYFKALYFLGNQHIAYRDPIRTQHVLLAVPHHVIDLSLQVFDSLNLLNVQLVTKLMGGSEHLLFH